MTRLTARQVAAANPAVRDQLALALENHPAAGRKRTTQHELPWDECAPLRCHQCHEPMPSKAAVAEHDETVGHHRYECIVDTKGRT